MPYHIHIPVTLETLKLFAAGRGPRVADVKMLKEHFEQLPNKQISDFSYMEMPPSIWETIIMNVKEKTPEDIERRWSYMLSSFGEFADTPMESIMYKEMALERLGASGQFAADDILSICRKNSLLEEERRFLLKSIELFPNENKYKRQLVTNTKKLNLK